MKNLLFNICKAIVIGALLWCCILFSGCLYTKNGAIRKFGCDTTAVKTDTSKPVLVLRDTIRDTIKVKGETIYTQSPCEEISQMKPGQSKIIKRGGTTQTYGKDSSGNSFFRSGCDSLISVSNWYKEKWLQTVHQTNNVQNKVQPKGKLERIKDGFLEFCQLLGLLLLIAVLVWVGLRLSKLF